MLSRRYIVGLVLLCSVTALLLLNCGETETGLTDAGAPVLTGPESAVPGIDIEKSTNGVDADTAPGPTIQVGDPVLWEYVVTNTGNVGLYNISVEDDVLGLICTLDFLAPGESVTCSATGAASAGQYVNTGTATWSGDGIPDVKDSDASHYFGEEAESALDIEKSTNGHDADTAPGPMIPVGDPVTWTYVVTNVGTVPLLDILVEDDVLGPICTLTKLEPGEKHTCTATGVAVVGQYANNGTATYSVRGGPQITDSDSSHYFGEEPAIRLEKSTNGHDADVAPGPTIPVGEPVTWTYVVTNVGNVPFTNIEFGDDKLGPICQRVGPLAPGDTMMCSAVGKAVVGQYRNLGEVAGTAPNGNVHTDEDPSHYFGEETSGDDGCSHGYWKNHSEDWLLAGYTPGQSVASVFGAAAAYSDIGPATLMEALKFHGGKGVEGGARNLLKQAVASLLNAAHPDVAFPRTEAGVISDVNAALSGGVRESMLDLAGDMDDDNNLGCPFDDDRERLHMRIKAGQE